MTKRTTREIPTTIEERDGVTVYTLHPGDVVLCDDCGDDWTNSPISGGLLFGSKAICPRCCGKWEHDAKRYDEQRFIRARCPEHKSFADWVRQDLR